MSKDYERVSESAEAFMYVTMSEVQPKRNIGRFATA
jgi:hypothetical protein